MEKSITHWKAANPLVFITSHLFIGVLLAQWLAIPVFRDPFFIALGIFGASIFLLLISRVITFPAIIGSLLYSSCLLSWGFAIHYATNNQNLFNIPYSVTFIETCRNAVIKKINYAIVNAEANGFAQALLLGVKSNLNKELLKAYNELGIIHIIAISGMHLEIIFKNLTSLTNWLPRKKYYLLLELLIVLFGVWTYTLMASASPSIVRASSFFSIYFVGKFFNQPTYVLNFIAAGLLGVLLFDIKHMYNIGLQLSYAAVIGIHLFHPLLNKMFPMDNPILVFLWNNFSVTLAAQLTTLPILAYHFHQMSTIVLLSNFIMVPLSNLLLYALVLLLCLPNFLGLIPFWGNIIQEYILFVNWFIQYLSLQSISSMAPLTFSKYTVITYYILLLNLYLWIGHKKVKYLTQAIWLLGLLYIIKLFS